MYRVAVCEDEPNLREALCAQCRGILGRLAVFHEVVPFATAEGLEEALSKGAQFDLLCLDILLTGKSGMELALDVRKRDDRVSILFITVSTDFLLEGYGARPIQYLLKPVREEDLEKALRTDLRLHHQPSLVTLKSGSKTTVLPWPEIRYVESRNHSCIFHMVRYEPVLALNLTQVEGLLPKEQFSRCHNSYLVNMTQIQKVNSREILLFDGERLPIGRRYSQQFQEEFVRYLNSRT